MATNFTREKWNLASNEVKIRFDLTDILAEQEES